MIPVSRGAALLGAAATSLTTLSGGCKTISRESSPRRYGSADITVVRKLLQDYQGTLRRWLRWATARWAFSSAAMAGESRVSPRRQRRPVVYVRRCADSLEQVSDMAIVEQLSDGGHVLFDRADIRAETAGGEVCAIGVGHSAMPIRQAPDTVASASCAATSGTDEDHPAFSYALWT